ncbi:porin family protein [bacterium]|nr:porin family protein [bacterium]
MKFRSSFICGILFITVFSLLSMSAFAETDIGLKGIGGKVGYVMPEGDLDATFTFGAVVDLGTFMPALHWDASIQYWGVSYEVGPYEWTYSDIALKSTARYHFTTGGKVTPYAGGGLGIHMFSFEWDCPSCQSVWGFPTSVSDNSTEFGFHGVGGIEFLLAPKWKAQAEAEYAIVDIDQFSIVANIIYLLGK